MSPDRFRLHRVRAAGAGSGAARAPGSAGRAPLTRRRRPYDTSGGGRGGAPNPFRHAGGGETALAQRRGTMRKLARHKVPDRSERQRIRPSIDHQETQLASINLESLDIEQLADLLGKAQAEMASREKGNRKELRAELERRVAAEGYKMTDIFPELGTGASSGARRKRPAKYRNPQNPEQTWSGIGRTPKWVQAIVDERGIDVATFKSIPMYQLHASG